MPDKVLSENPRIRMIRQLDLQLIDFGVQSQFARSSEILASWNISVCSIHMRSVVWLVLPPLFHFLGPLLSTKLLGTLGKDIYLYKYRDTPQLFPTIVAMMQPCSTRQLAHLALGSICDFLLLHTFQVGATVYSCNYPMVIKRGNGKSPTNGGSKWLE